MKCFILLYFLVLLAAIGQDTCYATTWAAMDVQMLVNDADLIVEGRISVAKAKAEGEKQEIGTIDVTHVVYGPSKLRTLQLILTSESHGLHYQVGDVGLWFLRVRPAGPSQMEAIQSLSRPPPAIFEYFVGGFATPIFIAEHPAKFWPDPGADAFMQRNRTEVGHITDQQREQRRKKLAEYVQIRLENDVRVLTKALKAS
ncbi:MAG: hypothetical protein EBU34_06090, partial [Alphaproteobacteria bacterium]|nr:hypothetical protein [Alphaproteobacteria bacterium]